MKTNYGPISVEPLTATIGAHVTGVDIGPIDDELAAHVHDAWMDWKVLFFHDQHVAPREHIGFARRFGDLEIHPFLPNDGNAEVVVLDTAGSGPSRAEAWHSDVSFRARPPMGSILRGRIIPPVGGDTLWADMEQAYEGLADTTKDRIEHLTATHSLRYNFGKHLSPDELERKLEEFPDQHHPVVRIHPVTGRRSLFVNTPFVVGIDGLEPDEGAVLLADLLSTVQRPTYQVRFRWQEDSFALWDNRCTQHCASQDFGAQRRRVERVTLVGERPAGPNMKAEQHLTLAR